MLLKSDLDRLASQYDRLETQYLSSRGKGDCAKAAAAATNRSQLKEAAAVASSLAGRLRSLSKCVSYLAVDSPAEIPGVGDISLQNGNTSILLPVYDLKVLQACEDLRISLTEFLDCAGRTKLSQPENGATILPSRNFDAAWRAQERDLAATLDLCLRADTLLDVARQLSSPARGRTRRITAEQLKAKVESIPLSDVVVFAGLDPLELSHNQRQDLAFACIEELNRPSHDWPLGELNEFRSRVQRRDQEVPFYAYAAEHWFEFAQEFWDHLRSQIMDFFSSQRANNRLQWILEYARRRCPGKYGPTALSPKAHFCLVEATKVLLPIHISAAFGLPALSRELLQAAPQRDNVLHSVWHHSLWCALVGPSIFLFADDDRDPTLKELIAGPRPVNQEETLKLLAEAGAAARDIKFDQDAKLSRSSRNPRWVAFLVALMIGNPELYLQLEDNPSGLDRHFLRQLEANGAFDLIPKHILRTEKCRVFLNRVFQEWLDRLLPDYVDGDIHEDLYHAIWRIIHDLGLECGNVLNKRRIETLSDEEFDTMLLIAANDASSHLVQHMIRDPRWNPNKWYNGTTYQDGGTLLHAAIMTENLQTVRLILESGADVEARDVKGRTPILLADGIETLEEMSKHNADMTVSDTQGHNIWHYQATEMDDKILEWLAIHDKNKHISLRAVSKKGRTPFAEALWTVRDLAKLYKGTKERRPVAARAILKACGGDFDGVFVCDVPLLSLVAEWGDEPLLDDLIDAWAGKPPLPPSIVEQSNPLHHINFSASPSFVKKLQGLSSGTCLLLEDKKTAAETIFTNFKYIPKLLRIRGQPNITQPLALSAHPSCKHELLKETYMQLLTPDVVSSEDSDGRGLWQRICIDNVAGWATTVEAPIVQDSLMTALRCLAEGEVLKNYEDKTGKCGLTLIPEAFMKGSRQVEIPNWMSAVFQLLLAQTTRLEEFKKSNHSLLCMRWAVRGGHKELLADLLERGLSVHARLEGTTMLEECCSANHPCDPATFTQLLKCADKSKLNEVDEYGQGLIHLLISPAVKFRDDKLKILLEHGADPNLRRAGNAPALVTYILERQLEAAYFLLDKGADFTLATKDGLDAALATASRGSTRLLAKIKSLAKPDFNWKRTCTSRFTIFHPGGQNTTFYASECNALHMAAFNGHDLVIQYYMSNFDIDPNAAVQDDLRRPAHFAALGGWSPCLRMLHSKGADLSLQARDGSTALHVATKSCQPGAVKALLELAPKNLPDRDGMTPYLHALRIGVKEIVEIFNGFMPAILPDRPRERATRKKARLLGGALETLTGLGDIESYRNVVRSTSPEEIDGAVLKCGGCTPIILAVRKGKTQLACYLVAAGCRGLTGSCKKHFGPLGGFDALTEICELEDLPPGAAGPAPRPPPGMAAWPVDARAMFAQTCYPFLEAYLRSGICWLAAALSPVHAVAHRNNFEAFNAIMTHLEFGDNPSAYRNQLLLSGKNRLSRSALSVPRNEWIKELQRLAVNQPITHASLHDPYEEGWTPLHVAMDSESFEVAAALLERGANVDATDRARCTPLHVAARKEFAPGVAMLLVHGANPDARDHMSYTPLMRAAENGHVEIARLLVQHGADAHVHEPDGMSLLNICGEQSKNPAMFAYLLTLGLDPYAEDKAGYMPLHDMILNHDFTAYVMNGDFDFARVRDISKGLMPMVIELNRHGAAAILKRLLLRLVSSSLGNDGPEGLARADVESGRARATDLAGRYPLRFVSALCQAVHRDELDCLPLLVGPLGGVDVDAEGAVEGSALMVACVKGRLEAVRILVRLGARTAYAFEERDEETGEVVVVVRNAVEAAKRFPDVVWWLLVGRYTEILRLGDGVVGVGEDTEDEEEDEDEEEEDEEGDEESEADDDDGEEEEEEEDEASSDSEDERNPPKRTRQTEEQRGDAPLQSNTQRSRKPLGIQPWSGVWVAEVELLGVGDQFGFCRDESRFEYLQRMASLRKSFRNMKVHPRGWFEMAGTDQLAESRWHVP